MPLNYEREIKLSIETVLDSFNDQVKGFNEVGYDHFLKAIEPINTELVIDLGLHYYHGSTIGGGDDPSELIILFTYHEFLVVNDDLFDELHPHYNEYQKLQVKLALIEGIDNIINHYEFYQSQLNYCREYESE